MATILLVDDEALVRRVVRVVLEAEGYDVLEAGSGHEALDRVDGADVVVLDLMMPGEDGLDVCRRIKSSRPGARVLVLSSVPEAEARREVEEAGADDFMLKPFSSLDLLRRVAELLET